MGEQKEIIENIGNSIDILNGIAAVQEEHIDNIKFLANKALHGYFIHGERKGMNECVFRELRATFNIILDYINIIVDENKKINEEAENLFSIISKQRKTNETEV